MNNQFNIVIYNIPSVRHEMFVFILCTALAEERSNSIRTTICLTFSLINLNYSVYEKYVSILDLSRYESIAK